MGGQSGVPFREVTYYRRMSLGLPRPGAALFARRPAVLYAMPLSVRSMRRALSSRSSTLTEQYDALVDRGELQYNPQQRELAYRLQQLRMELRKHSELTRGYASDLRVWHARVAEVMRLREEAAAREAARRAALPLWQLWFERMIGRGSPAVPSQTVASASAGQQVHGITIDAIPRKEQQTLMQDVTACRGSGGSGGGGDGCSSGGGGGGCSSRSSSSENSSSGSSSSDSSSSSGSGSSVSSASASASASASGGSSASSCGSSGSCAGQGSCASSPEKVMANVTPAKVTVGDGTGTGSIRAAVSSRSSYSTGQAVAPPTLQDLSEQERRHPFWVSGLGSALLRRPLDGTQAPSGASAGGAERAAVASDALSASAAASYELPAPPPPPPPPPRGLFIHGDVGAGKTLLMDLFADAIAADVVAARERAAAAPAAPAPAAAVGESGVLQVRRVHFNAFIQECHKRLHSHSLAIAARLKWERHVVSSLAQQRASVDMDDAFSVTPAAAAATAAAAPTASAAASAAARPWDAIAELVRRLVTESSAPERHEDFHAALDAISTSIVHADATAAARTADAGGSATANVAAALDEAAAAPAPLVEDPEGRPVSAGVLCFDEVQMMDVADATITAGVLHRLFEAGWVLVATCNRTPDEFAKSVLHREHPQARFTARVLGLCDMMHLQSPSNAAGEQVDYRTVGQLADEPLYLCPLCEATAQTAAARFAALGGQHATPMDTRLGYGRMVRVLASPEHGVAKLSFAALCDSPLGASDYIALAQQFHTVFLLDVPQLSMQQRDQARRFITLVDQLYNHRTKLVTTAAVPLSQLFRGASADPDAHGSVHEALEGLEFEGEAGKAAVLNPIGVTANSLASSRAGAHTARVSADSRKALVRDSLFTGEDEVFAFRRALSRLTEMQSAEWLGRAGPLRPHVSAMARA